MNQYPLKQKHSKLVLSRTNISYTCGIFHWDKLSQRAPLSLHLSEDAHRGWFCGCRGFLESVGHPRNVRLLVIISGKWPPNATRWGLSYVLEEGGRASTRPWEEGVLRNRGLRNEGTGVVPAPGAVSEKSILPGALNSSGSPAGRLGKTGPDNSEASRG